MDPYNVRSQSPCKKGKDIVRKLRRAGELAAAGRTGEEIADELAVSPATLFNWRRAYGGMDTDAAKELKELREQNARLKRLLAEAEPVKDALREVGKDNFGLSCQALRRRHAHDYVEHVGTVGVQSGWACLLHPPTTASSPDTRQSRRAFADLVACLRHQTPVPRVPARLGRVAPRRAP
jgi:putative transposase